MFLGADDGGLRLHTTYWEEGLFTNEISLPPKDSGGGEQNGAEIFSPFCLDFAKFLLFYFFPPLSNFSPFNILIPFHSGRRNSFKN